MYQEFEGAEALEMLYNSGLIENNNRKRLTDRKAKIFIEIWNNPEQSYQRIAKNHHLTHGTVKTYASQLFKLIGNFLNEKINQGNLKSSVYSFLLTPAQNWRGIVSKEGSILDNLSHENRNFVKDCARKKNISEADVLNEIIDDLRKSS
jgi:hypothetical protein